MRWTEAAILDAYEEELRASGAEAAMLRQVAVLDRRLDALVTVRTSVGWRRTAIEVKVSRADFRNDNDAKRAPAEAIAHECRYLAPHGLLGPDDMPPGWALTEIQERERSIAWPAAARADPVLGDDVLDEVVTRCAEVERRVRMATQGAEHAAQQALLIEDLFGRLQRRDVALERERQRARAAAQQVAASLGEQTCADCDEPIVYTRLAQWEHRDKTMEAACLRKRREAYRQARQRATGAAYLLGPAAPVMPHGIA